MDNQEMIKTFLEEVPNILLVVVTFLLYLATRRLSILTKRLHDANERLNWFTGSMESYAKWNLILQAEDMQKSVIWWDPSQEDWPHRGEHKKPVDATEITIGVHPTHRSIVPKGWEN